MRFFLTEFFQGIRIALEAIRANKLRSVLTTLGIIIGVVSITLMGTVIEGLNLSFDKTVSSMGADVLYVSKFAWFSSDDWRKFRNRKDITKRHLLAIEQQAHEASVVVPSVNTGAKIKVGDKSIERVGVLGTTDEYIKTTGLTLENGRFMTDIESGAGRNVTVLGFDVAKNLFGDVNPVGKEVKLGGEGFEVLGIFEKQGGFSGGFVDSRVIIPIKNFYRLFGSRRSLTIGVKALSPNSLEDTRDELHGIMRAVRKLKPNDPDDFTINEQDMFKQFVSTTKAVIQGVGFGITGLSLLVGGIGIMNIMFVSVKERTKEIGIRRAIGARKRTILLQFIVEAATLSLVGGIIALSISYPLSLWINQYMTTVMPASIVVIALVIAVGTGVVFGFIPSYKAANLDPVEALRYE